MLLLIVAYFDVYVLTSPSQACIGTADNHRRRGGWLPALDPPPPRTSKSHIGELAPMALCDIHVAGCGEPGVFVMIAYRGLIRPSGEDAMGRSCILDSPPGRGMPAAVQMPAVVRRPACHSRRFKGERPIGAATG